MLALFNSCHRLTAVHHYLQTIISVLLFTFIPVLCHHFHFIIRYLRIIMFKAKNATFKYRSAEPLTLDYYHCFLKCQRLILPTSIVQPAHWSGGRSVVDCMFVTNFPLSHYIIKLLRIQTRQIFHLFGLVSITRIQKLFSSHKNRISNLTLLPFLPTPSFVISSSLWIDCGTPEFQVEFLTSVAAL